MIHPVPPRPTPRSRIVEHIVSRPGFPGRLRARHFGLDWLLRRPPVLELYYEPGDPHSHLAAQLLPLLGERLRIPLAIRVVGEPDAVVYPEAELQRAYALADAARIAPAYGLHFADTPRRPDPDACMLAARSLLATPGLQAFCAAEPALAAALFAGRTPDTGGPMLPVAPAQAQLAANNARRAALGNYLPGIWQLNGIWYWGVDRLDHLAADLRRNGWLTGDEPLLTRDTSRARLPEWDAQELEFFYSFRSPYSYLAAEAIQAMHNELPVPLRIRPVLPMAMRGMKIPPYKGLYLARDVKREATRLNIPFGRIADPLGPATERCLTVFNLLDDARQQLAFLVSHSRAVWSEGIDVATDAGLRYVWERAGLDWPRAADKLAEGRDLDLAEVNRQALFEAGCWGVPTFRLGAFVTWGNDRIWMLEEMFRRSRT